MAMAESNAYSTAKKRLTTLRIAAFDSHYCNSCKQLHCPLSINLTTNIFLP